MFTDAGRYAIHFGSHPSEAAKQLSTAIHAQHPDQPPPPVTALARYRTGVEVIPTSTGNQLVVHRPLILPERMVALAAAISIDYGESTRGGQNVVCCALCSQDRCSNPHTVSADFFSRHSSGGGGLLSPFIVPPIIPYPVETGAETPPESEPEAAAPEYEPDSSSPVDEPLERNLGDDNFWGGQVHDIVGRSHIHSEELAAPTLNRLSSNLVIDRAPISYLYDDRMRHNTKMRKTPMEAGCPGCLIFLEVTRTRTAGSWYQRHVHVSVRVFVQYHSKKGC